MRKTIVIGYDIKYLSDDYVYEFTGLTPRQELELLKYFGKQELGKKHRFWEKIPYIGDYQHNVRIYLKVDYEKKGNI